MVEAQQDVVGIVYKTDAVTSDKVRIVLEVPVRLTPEISYAAALIGSGRDAKSERSFLDFLAGSEASIVFCKHGFITWEASARP